MSIFLGGLLHKFIGVIGKSLDWLIDRLIRRLIDWLIDWLVDRLIDWLIVWLIDWLICRLIDWLIDRFFDWLIDWLVACSVHWLIDWLTCFSVYRVVSLALQETMYEWGNPECAASLMSSLSESDNTLAKCVYRWRTRVQQTGQPAYYGWKVVLAADPKRMDGYIRLLEAGGAKVLASAYVKFLSHTIWRKLFDWSTEQISFDSLIVRLTHRLLDWFSLDWLISSVTSS